MSWIMEHHRKRLVMAIAFAMMADLMWFVLGHPFFARRELEHGVAWVALPLTFVQLFALGALCFRLFSPNSLEMLLCFTILLETSIRVKMHSQLDLSSFLLYSTCLCIRFRSFGIMSLIIHAIIALCTSTWSYEAAIVEHIRFFVGSIVGCIVIIFQHAEWQFMFRLQHDSVIEKKAMEKVLAMVCDASCWLAADGKSVLRSDCRLDDIVGLKAMGENFHNFIPEEERERFCLATAAAGAKRLNDPVDLLPSTLNGPGLEPYRVDLFIVDVRSEYAATGHLDCPGFLIGVRLTVPYHIAVPEVERDIEAPLDPMPLCSHSHVLACNSTSSPRLGQGWDDASCTSLPETLSSVQLPSPVIHECCREAVAKAINSDDSHVELPGLASPRMRDTLAATLELMCDCAVGGALVCIADAEAFQQVFATRVSDSLWSRSCTRSADQGYMTDLLRGIHVRDARFVEAFREFTRHTSDDRWPSDHPDERARGKPKDGAMLLSSEGYRVQCSAKLLGLAPAASWANVGTKHEAALACAWAIPGSFVFVKSDSGPLHLIVKQMSELHVFFVHSKN